MSGARGRIVAVLAVVAGLHVVGFGLLALALAGPADGVSAFGVGTGVLAYTLGLRHAFDVDHIAAIDNVTRKLRGEGRRPVAVGFAFALGHSTVVLLLTLLLALGGHLLGGQVRDEGSALHQVTGTIGPLVSGAFLLAVAAANLVTLRAMARALRRPVAPDATVRPAQGPMGRLLGRPAALIDRTWKMFPLGFLFGLGFDTATEIGLLLLAGSGVVAQLPLWAVLSLPILFAAGMSLMDTLDGAFMNVAYGWSHEEPRRRLRYDLTVTGCSVAIAGAIGALELAQVAHERLGWPIGPLADVDAASAGYVVVGLFVVIFACVAVPALRRTRAGWQPS